MLSENESNELEAEDMNRTFLFLLIWLLVFMVFHEVMKETMVVLVFSSVLVLFGSGLIESCLGSLEYIFESIGVSMENMLKGMDDTAYQKGGHHVDFSCRLSVPGGAIG